MPDTSHWPACATYPNLGCVCRGALQANKSTCTRKRTGDLAPAQTAADLRRKAGMCTACGHDSDGPTDSNGDHWCVACRDAAVSA